MHIVQYKKHDKLLLAVDCIIFGFDGTKLKNVTKLIFDHRNMIELSKKRLREKISNHPVGFELLPEKFTLQQLQNLYEAIYEITFDRRNFSRKILGLQIFKKLDEKEKT